MYINFNTLRRKKDKYELSDLDIFKLIAIKTKEPETIQEYNSEEDFERFLQKGLVKFIKAKKKSETKFELVRLDKEGEKLLVDISTNLEITDEVEKLFSYLEKIYKGRSSGIVRNKIETKRRCSWFINTTGFSGNRLAILIKSFCMDTYDPSSNKSIVEAKEENPRLVLSNMLDNVFWTPENHFSRHYKLEESPLYRYYQDNEDYIIKIWNYYEEQGRI